MNSPVHIASISELHSLTGLTEPDHPLIGMYMLRELPQVSVEHVMDMAMKLSLYTVMYKAGVEGSIGYGRMQYDYENGTLIFTAPGQELQFERKRHATDSASWMLLFHPDFLAGTDLGRRMDEYTYFGYEVTEALHLSTSEQAQALEVGHRIKAEYSQRLDAHSHKLIVNNLELLLNHCTRFCDRQFFQRTAMHSGLLDQAKHGLASSEESIGEIAFGLGFEQPQSFTRLFKKHTGVTPKTYRSNLH